MAAVDTFSSNSNGLSSPITNHFSITPHDTNELSYVTREIYVGGSGDVVLVTEDDEEVTYSGVFGGTFINGRFKQVKAANTTATNLVGRY